MENSNIEVLYAERDGDVQAWDVLVDQAPLPDVYYRPGYVLAYREPNVQSICAVVINAAGFRCLVPLMISDSCSAGDKNSSLGTYAYSPYGYGGLLPLNSLSPPNGEQVLSLWQALQVWSRENGMVCAVLRLHPLFGQDLWFDAQHCDDAIVLKGNQTISVDLTRWNEQAQCIGSLNRGRRSDLNYARRKLRLSWAFGSSEESRQALEVFQVIYNDHKRALNANQFYFFPHTYYAALARGLDRRLAICLAWHGDEPVGGTMFMADTQYAHAHLSGTNTLGHDSRAATLLMNAGASWARKRGCEQLHMGGGLKDEDALFRFKRSFGGRLLRHATLTVVANRAAFNSLCQIPDVPWPFTMHRAAILSNTHTSSEI